MTEKEQKFYNINEDKINYYLSVLGDYPWDQYWYLNMKKNYQEVTGKNFFMNDNELTIMSQFFGIIPVFKNLKEFNNVFDKNSVYSKFSINLRKGTYVYDEVRTILDAKELKGITIPEMVEDYRLLIKEADNNHLLRWLVEYIRRERTYEEDETNYEEIKTLL